MSEKVDRYRLTYDQLLAAAMVGKTVYVASYNCRERDWVKREMVRNFEEKMSFKFVHEILKLSTHRKINFPSGGSIIFAVADHRGNEWARGITFFGGVGSFEGIEHLHFEP